MKTLFVDASDKGKLFDKLLKGDEASAKYVITEIDRLENIIRNYEIALEVSVSRLDNTLYKTPQKLG